MLTMSYVQRVLNQHLRSSTTPLTCPHHSYPASKLLIHQSDLFSFGLLLFKRLPCWLTCLTKGEEDRIKCDLYLYHLKFLKIIQFSRFLWKIRRFRIDPSLLQYWQDWSTSSTQTSQSSSSRDRKYWLTGDHTIEQVSHDPYINRCRGHGSKSVLVVEASVLVFLSSHAFPFILYQ